MRGNRQAGFGEVLYESATIAFDTGRGIYFNPVTKLDYGVNPPAGGWPISWYGTVGNVNVPVGPGVVAQTQEQANLIKQQVQTQLTSTNANTQTQSTNVTTNPVDPAAGILEYLQNHELFGIQDTYIAIGGVVLLGWYMFGGRRGRR